MRGASRAFQRGEHLLRPEWHRAQPNAGGIAYRVRDRRRHDRRRRLADAPRFFRRAVDEMDVDVRNFGKRQDRIAAQSTLVTREQSKVTCSFSTRLTVCSTLPST